MQKTVRNPRGQRKRNVCLIQSNIESKRAKSGQHKEGGKEAQENRNSQATKGRAEQQNFSQIKVINSYFEHTTAMSSPYELLVTVTPLALFPYPRTLSLRRPVDSTSPLENFSSHGFALSIHENMHANNRLA